METVLYLCVNRGWGLCWTPLQKLYQLIQQSPLFITSTHFLIEILDSKNINNDEKTKKLNKNNIRSSNEFLMACQVIPEIMTELLALKKKILDDVCHLRGSCQVYHERELIVPLWLIQTCQLVSKCFFILVYVVNINNAHAGLSLTSVLAKSNMDGFTSCARLSPRPFFLSLPLLSTSSSLFYPFPPLSVPVSERRRMALTPSLIERCGPSAVIGGAAVVGFL